MIDALFARFKSRAEAANTEVLRFANSTNAEPFIVEFLREHAVADVAGSWAAFAESSFFNRARIERIAAELPGLRAGFDRTVAKDAKIGLSQMDWAVSDTGTLVQDATRVDARLVSTLPEIHLAVVKTHALVPDLTSLLALVAPESMPYLAMITGPSRTADIERVLTIGVHGPVRLMAVFIDALD